MCSKTVEKYPDKSQISGEAKVNYLNKKKLHLYRIPFKLEWHIYLLDRSYMPVMNLSVGNRNITIPVHTKFNYRKIYET